jgi:hypothetical protein
MVACPAESLVAKDRIYMRRAGKVLRDPTCVAPNHCWDLVLAP